MALGLATRVVALTLLLPIAVGTLISASARAQGGPHEASMPRTPIEAVLRQHAGRLMALPGVVGIAEGVCAGKPCVKVFVARKTPDVLKALPSSLEGYPIAVEETGELRPFPPPGR